MKNSVLQTTSLKQSFINALKTKSIGWQGHTLSYLTDKQNHLIRFSENKYCLLLLDASLHIRITEITFLLLEQPAPGTALPSNSETIQGDDSADGDYEHERES